MIIIGKYGQLGNRLFLFSHFIAWSAEYKIKIINPSFYEYAKFFKKTGDDLFCGYPSGFRWEFYGKEKIRKIIYKFIQLIIKSRFLPGLIHHLEINNDEFINLNDENFLKLAKSKTFLIIQGWKYRDDNAFKKNADLIRQFFEPVDTLQNNITTLMKKARKNCDVLIGVHIRHGDYDTFKEGIYFYSTDKYIKIMDKIMELFPDIKVGFLICSNVKLEEKKFHGLDFLFGTNHFVEDMYSLAKCDYIIGPPSTYSMWASFYGKVPLLIIRNPDENPSLEMFEVMENIV